MNQIYYFCVADFYFSISSTLNIEKMLPSFSPFRINLCSKKKLLFTMTLVPELSEYIGKKEVWEISDNDLGNIRLLRTNDGYCIELKYMDGFVHQMQTNFTFTSIQIHISTQDRYAGEALSSLVRIVFSQAILLHGGVSVHASAVTLQGFTYLFMGKSGTGKSTHASLWLSCFTDSKLLNDDNPIVRIKNRVAYVYGSPWSGKTSCYINEGYKLGGTIRLIQASENCFTFQTCENAFITLLPGCSVIHKDERLYDYLCNTLAVLAEIVPVGILQCKPDREAALMCASAMNVTLT